MELTLIGSDYPISFLKKRVGELMGLIPCDSCGQFIGDDVEENDNLTNQFSNKTYCTDCQERI